MKAMDKKEKLKKSYVAFFLCLLMCFWSFSVFTKSIDNQIVWKIIASSVGFLFFLTLTFLLFLQMVKVRKNF